MLKLYKRLASGTLYWETWENDGKHTIHWGELGTKGESRTVASTLFTSAKKIVQREIDQKVSDGYAEIETDDHRILLIEYALDPAAGAEQLDKRHALESRMNEVLGWTGLGHCDGGSIGSGTMEACCYVVDFALAKTIIERELLGTPFADFTRIYDEDGEAP